MVGHAIELALALSAFLGVSYALLPKNARTWLDAQITHHTPKEPPA